MLHHAPKPFGIADGKQATEYTIENAQGAKLSVTDYGARVTHLLLPNADGTETDVVLGYDDAAGYAAGDECFGAICGRYANRLANAAFTLNGQTYSLDANDHGNTLHGGSRGFHQQFFNVEQTENGLRCSLKSPDGDMGFPGTLTLTVLYELTDETVLRISYDAVCPDADTLANFTNHCYFNLDGSDTILDHRLEVKADFYTPSDPLLLPTGEIRSVAGTGFDLRTPVRLRDRIRPIHKDLAATDGYDHNFVLRQAERCTLTHAATLTGSCGRRMECYTTMPGLQIYSSNALQAPNGRNGQAYLPHTGICLETQFFPNAMVQTHFPSPILKRGERHVSMTEYRFFAR